MIHRRLNEWTGRVLINWQRNFERRKLLKSERKLEQEQELDQDKLKEVAQEYDINLKPDYPLPLSSESFQEHHYMNLRNYDAPTQISSDSSIEQSGSEADTYPPTTLELERYPSQQQSGGGPSRNITVTRPMVSDIYEMLVAMEAKVADIRKMYSENVVGEDLSSKRLLREIRALTIEESDGRRTSERLEQTIFQMNQEITNIHQHREAHTLRESESATSLKSFTETEADWDIRNFNKFGNLKEPPSSTTSHDNTSGDSGGSSITSADSYHGMAVTSIPFHRSKTELSFSEQAQMLRRNNSNPELGTLEKVVLPTSRSVRSITGGGGGGGGSRLSSGREPHPFFLTQPPATLTTTTGMSMRTGMAAGEEFRGEDYHYIMNRVRSSDSLSSLGNTSIDIQDSQAAYLEGDNEISLSADEQQYSEPVLMPFVAKKRSLNIDFSTLPSSAAELAIIFEISLLSVFDGGEQ